MSVKNGYLLSITENTIRGIGECSFIEDLSIDDIPNYEAALKEVCSYIENPSLVKPNISLFPSIRFGWECALLDLKGGGREILFDTDFTKGINQIPINGLVWMGSKEFMQRELEEKLQDGFRCIKIKVGAIGFNEEINLLKFIRQRFPKDAIEIRLDANGAFQKDDVFKKLEILADFDIHSIEQPVKAGELDLMSEVCSYSPIPVALDEELIRIKECDMEHLLEKLCPHYIILKPSLLGGFKVCDKWIELAERKDIGWWATSALESNIGLNAIAQWVFTKNNAMVQGLGTGGLFIDNISSPLFIQNGNLAYDPNTKFADKILEH